MRKQFNEFDDSNVTTKEGCSLRLAVVGGIISIVLFLSVALLGC